MDNLKTLDLALYTFILAIIYFIGLVLYRLHLHPLSHIPGPRVAAITSYYVFYYDIVKDGTFIDHLPELHRKYGINLYFLEYLEVDLFGRPNCSY